MLKNVAGQIVTFSLFKAGARVENPTIAASGDFKVKLDAGAQNNVTTQPTSDAAGIVTWLPTQAETNADIVTFAGLDVIGAQWEPLTMMFDTRTETAVGLYLDAAITSRALPGSAMTLTGAERTATAGVIWATILEGAHTVADGLRIMLAALAGRSTGGGTFTNRFRDVANTKNRIAATVDANGNRTAITTLDGT